jgi:Flp pilus assembly pilin Flp
MKRFDIRRMVADRNGATAVEFALVLPVFVLLVMGSISTGLLGWSIASMNYAVEDAARCAAVNKVLCASPDDVRSYALSRYMGPAISPVFSYSSKGCGNTVTGHAVYSLMAPFAGIKLSASACHPTA